MGGGEEGDLCLLLSLGDTDVFHNCCCCCCSGGVVVVIEVFMRVFMIIGW